MDRQIIATELLKGQGLGNRLFCYVTTRCLALESGRDFAILNRELLADNIHNDKGIYFMDLDCGVELQRDELENVYHEKEERIYLGNSKHDIKNGCYVAGADEALWHFKESTLLYGNLQSEAYFGKYRAQIREWLRVKPEYDNMEYSRENLCIINIRGGEYAGSPELFLRRKYWLDAMKIMRGKRSDMEFMVVTDDLEAARRILPEVEAFHFDLAGDYTVIKNAHYLILSNSTFAFFPAFTGEAVKYIIAPKYWARHNVSDGYWASEQNIYSDFVYLDRRGRLFTAKECRRELEEYKRNAKKRRQPGKQLRGVRLIAARLHAAWLIDKDLSVRLFRSLRRRIRGRWTFGA
ncbi:MAG: alpha-1,2-fucosyltransferase [Lachnospiraceae bacterium]|nr:alpha-1,2-fucosyltransferase [Lachnospiraceae bacterium]